MSRAGAAARAAAAALAVCLVALAVSLRLWEADPAVPLHYENGGDGAFQVVAVGESPFDNKRPSLATRRSTGAWMPSANWRTAAVAGSMTWTHPLTKSAKK